MRVRADDDPKVEPMLHLQNTRASRRVASAASAHSALRRPLIGIVIGASLLASAAAGIAFAPAALGAVPSEAALAQAAQAVDHGKVALANAQAMNNVVAQSAVQPAAAAIVAVGELRDDVRALSAPDDMSGQRLIELTEEVTEGTAALRGETTALRDALGAARVAQAAEDARVQAEAARIAAEEAEAAAQALAAANTPEGAKATAEAMASEVYGWGAGEFSCLESLWTKESGWNYEAYNNDGGATGIPQALPGDKMAAAGADWQTNATTQIAWGLDYIQRAYGSPCSAWGHSQAVNWY